MTVADLAVTVVDTRSWARRCESWQVIAAIELAVTMIDTHTAEW